MGLPMVGHFGLEEAGHPGIKNMNSSKCYKTHFLPTVQPIPCFMGGGPYVSGRRGLGERGEAPQQVLITTKNTQLVGRGGGANFTEFI